MFNISKKISTCIILCASLSMTAYANQNTVQINYAGKERMLSQKLSKEMFMVAAGYNKDENLQNLRRTADSFQEILEALKHGDETLGIDAVESEKVQNMLTVATHIWEPISRTVDNVIINGHVGETDAQFIYKNNFTLVRYMSQVVRQLEVRAALDGYDYKKAIGVNVAGRQRMLIQKAAKEYFMIQAGIEVDSNKEKLEKTISLFEVSLKDLQKGNRAKNIAYQSNPYFQSKLSEVVAQWDTFKIHLDNHSDEGNVAVAEQNIPLLKTMNQAVMIMSSL